MANRRTLDAKTRQRVLAVGRRKDRPTAAEAAEELGVDLPIVRRLWQANGLVKASAETKARAKRLVETWEARYRSDNGSARKSTARKSPARKAAGAAS